jgi:exopolyphosphatase/pppGpp-phosphohydrolase
VDHDPPRPKELKELRKTVPGMLPGWKLPKKAEIVAVGGSARALLRITRDKLTQKRLRKLAEEISEISSGMFARETGLSVERARVLPAAASTLETILSRYDRPALTVARGGIREGVVLTLAERNGG